MRKIPTLLSALFVAITLVRVAALVDTGFRAGWLGWVFSIGLGAGVFFTAYSARVSSSGKNGEEDKRSRDARISSMVTLIFFIAVDGVFNLLEVLRSLTDPTLVYAAWLYGLFPTVAAGLLGITQGYIDRLPKPPQKYNVGVAIQHFATTWINARISNVAGDVQAQLLSPEEAAYQRFAATMRENTMTAREIMTEFHLPVPKAYEWLNRYKAETPAQDPPV